MPIYEYRCAGCAERFELLASRRGRNQVRCPRCGSVKVDRMFSTFAVVKSGAPPDTPGPCGSTDCACRSRLDE